MELTELELRIIRTTGISRKDFEATKVLEMAEAAKTGTVAADPELTEADMRVIAKFGLSKEKFLEERRRERGTSTTASAGSRGDAKSREKFLVTADAGEVNRIVAARDAQRIARAS